MADWDDEVYYAGGVEAGERRARTPQQPVTCEHFVWLFAVLLAASVVATAVANGAGVSREWHSAVQTVALSRRGAAAVWEQDFCKLQRGEDVERIMAVNPAAKDVDPEMCHRAEILLAESARVQVLRDFANRYAICEAGRCARAAGALIEYMSWYALAALPLALVGLAVLWRGLARPSADEMVARTAQAIVLAGAVQHRRHPQIPLPDKKTQ
jgi:hypothetical protein